jgi:hypothetical protein
VLAVALHRARVADTGGIVGIGAVRGRRVAGQAGEDTLSEGTQGVGAIFNALRREYVSWVEGEG